MSFVSPSEALKYHKSANFMETHLRSENSHLLSVP